MVNYGILDPVKAWFYAGLEGILLRARYLLLWYDLSVVSLECLEC